VNASLLPSVFSSPAVITCSIVFSFNWIQSNVVLASVIFASGFLRRAPLRYQKASGRTIFTSAAL
jgi:hypothetical protein